MLSMMPFGFLFIFILTFGSIFSLSSLHWLSIWMGLEVNLMGFIPVLVYRGMTQETESGMKYFIIQALGSGMLMMGSLLSFSSSFSWEMLHMNTMPGLLLLIFSLLLKLGSFPFHFWLPGVMAGLSWMGCLILATWQKLAPIFLLSALLQSWLMTSWLINLILLFAGLSSMTGGIGGLNQTQIRALLAYSSIGHMGWMIFCATLNQSALKMYFLIYLTVSLSVFSTLWLSETSFFNQVGTLKPENNKLNEISLIFMLLSLGGMPPLLGFVGKWLAIWSCCMNKIPLSVMLLLLGSLISLFYYLSLLFFTTFFSGLNLTLKNQIFLFDAPTIMPVKKFLSLSNYAHNSTKMIISILMLNLIGGLLISFMLLLNDFS